MDGLDWTGLEIWTRLISEEPNFFNKIGEVNKNFEKLGCLGTWEFVHYVPSRYPKSSQLFWPQQPAQNNGTTRIPLLFNFPKSTENLKDEISLAVIFKKHHANIVF